MSILLAVIIKMRLRYVALLILFSFRLQAQDSITKKNIFQWSAFTEVYFSYDFNKPQNHQKPFFLYNHNRHNEFNINLALLKASFSNELIRTNLGLMSGTYAQSNLAAEPELLRNIYEANIGIKISRNHDFWLDAGILPSHIGNETPVSTENPTLTRSIAAENSPYYETGIKLTYQTPDSMLMISGLILNGWQRISRPDGHNSLCFGSQFTLMISPKTRVNWSTFIGNDKPGSARQSRFFNNLFTVVKLNSKWDFTANFDIGWQQRINSHQYDYWLSPIFILRFKSFDSWSMALRWEYYYDPAAIIVAASQSSGAKVFGASFNFDKHIDKRCQWRTELRVLSNDDPIFLRDGTLRKNNISLTTSLAINFNSLKEALQ